MYYVHYDSYGRPDMFTGYKSRVLERAIKYCDSLQSKAYVSKEVDIRNPFTGEPSKGFEEPVYCNQKDTI